jgi:hypothetical protein
MALATSSIVFQMTHERGSRREALLQNAARSRSAVTRIPSEDLPPGVDDLTPTVHSNHRSFPRLKFRIFRWIPGLSGA